jgi:hypothetical protein
VQYVRVYDASRQPRDWMDLIRPGQFVVFPSLVEGGEPCGFDGAPQDHHLAVCAIADSLTEAEQACRDLVAGHPTVRFDVFDSAGRSHPPLLTIVHTRIAIALIVAAPLLMWLDWTASGLMIVPTVVAVNGLLLAARLLQLNAAYGANERRQRERLASLEAESSRRE